MNHSPRSARASQSAMPMASAAAICEPIVSRHRSGAQPLPWGLRALRRGGVPTGLTLLVFVFVCGSALPLRRSKWPRKVNDKAVKKWSQPVNYSQRVKMIPADRLFPEGQLVPADRPEGPAALVIAGPEHQPHHQQQAAGTHHRLDPVSIGCPKHCQG